MLEETLLIRREDKEMARNKMTDVMVLLPGITGSVLNTLIAHQKEGETRARA